jgi:peptidoglycan hydrolase-like protein with peptidoglycan-binding domain
LRQITITAEPKPEPVTEVAALPTPDSIAPVPIAPAELVTPPVTEVAVVTEPVVTPEPVPEPVVDNTELIISLQKELRRAGCNPGPADGIWGPRSQRAVRSFSRDGDIEIASTDPSESLLEILKSKEGVVCVQAPPPTTTPKKRTTTANTTAAAPKPTQAAPEPEPEPEVTVTYGNDDDEDCDAGIFIFGMMGC